MAIVVMVLAITNMKCNKKEMFQPDLSNDNTLRSLILSGNGYWKPKFDPDVFIYIYTVADTVESITLTPKAYSKMSKITVNDKKCRSHAMSAPIPLEFGNQNTVVIQVTAENGDVQKYSVMVVRMGSTKKGDVKSDKKGDEKDNEKGDVKGDEKGDENTLKSLTLSGDGSWEPEFDPEVSIYKYTVQNTVKSITVTPETNSGKSQITINGKRCKSKEESVPIPLKVGTRNEIVIQVEAENGDVRKYIVMTERLPPMSDDNSLKSLTLSGNGSWSRRFRSSVLNYTYTVLNPVESITITPVANSEKSKITINDKECKSKEKSEPIPLEVGAGKNVIAVKVTAENGDGRQYTIIAVRKASEEKKDDDAALSSITISGASIKPGFNPDILAYTVTVPETKVPLDVNASARSEKARIRFKIDGKDVKNQHEINFSGTTANLVVEVIAGDGSTKRIYTFVVIKSTDKSIEPSKSNANLRGMDITFGKRNSKRPVYNSFNEPKKTRFDPSVTNYAVVVYACESITLTATADDPAVTSIVFNDNNDGKHRKGVKTGNVKLIAGFGKVTKVTISVTGRDKSTVKKYHLEVKLLNADEFFYGIFAPGFSKSFARWRNVVSNPGLGLNEIISGYVTGTLRWWIELKNSKGINNMKFSKYCDGNDDQGNNPIYTPYNDNTGENSKDGFVIDGSSTGEMNMEGNGFQRGNYHLSTPWGDPIGFIDIHYILKGTKIADSNDSYVMFNYMGKKYRYFYDFSRDDFPYPFTKDYDWNKPWKCKK